MKEGFWTSIVRASLATSITLLVACQSSEPTAIPSGDPLPASPAAPVRPSPTGPSFNAITVSSAITSLANVQFTPSFGYSPHTYELRFAFNGYTSAHMEPRVGTDPAGPSTMFAVIRTGSSDYVHLEVCAREYAGPIYLGCYGSGSADYYAGDNGSPKTVYFSDGGGSSNAAGTFQITISWPAVNVTPTSVTVSPSSVPLTVGYFSEQLTATAFDANSVQIPGLSVSWNSGNASIASVDANGLATPVNPGSTTISATISGVSNSSNITVFAPLSLTLNGPSSHQPNQSCEFFATVNSGDATTPYSYSWTALGQVGSSQYFYPNSAGASSQYQVLLRVTDAAGRQGSATKMVNVGSQYMQCPE